MQRAFGLAETTARRRERALAAVEPTPGGALTTLDRDQTSSRARRDDLERVEATLGTHETHLHCGIELVRLPGEPAKAASDPVLSSSELAKVASDPVLPSGEPAKVASKPACWLAGLRRCQVSDPVFPGNPRRWLVSDSVLPANPRRWRSFPRPPSPRPHARLGERRDDRRRIL